MSEQARAASKAGPSGESGKKRARYTSVACNECKRRKIRCNGEKPCERCGNQALECVYTSHDFQDSDDYKRMAGQIEVLEGQVKDLYAIVNHMRREINALKGLGDSDLYVPPPPPTPTGVPSVGVAAAGGGARVMDVDMSRDGRILFSEHVEHPLANHPDLLLSMELLTITRLFSVYTNHIHPLFPMIRIEDALWKLDEIREYRAALTKSAMQTAMTPATSPLQDDGFILIKMVLAVASKSESLTEEVNALALYNEVQEIYKVRGYPPSQQEAGPEELRAAGFQSWAETSIRLRLLQAFWYFQHGQEEDALTEVSEARRNVDHIVSGPTIPEFVVDLFIRLEETVYTMYWLINVLVKNPPRMNLAIDGTPAINFLSDFGKDDEGTLRAPLLEYAKMCSVMSYAFETIPESQGILDALAPQWSRDAAVNYIHRWQSTFGDGLRSLTTVRFESLASKSTKERIMQSCVYLLSNYLRLMICSYKRSKSGGRYEGPIEEFYGSAKYAQDSLLALWNVHQTVTTWHTHRHLYNILLLQAADWLYELISSRSIMVTPEVKMAFDRALLLTETYASELPRAVFVLQKLRSLRDQRGQGIAA